MKEFVRTASIRIKQQRILEKLDTNQQLKSEDYSLLYRILCSLAAKKELINYIFIFVLSAIALVIAVYLDFFR